MAQAKQLPSGQWRTLVYDYTDSSGKRHYRSFTASTKRESAYLAAEYAAKKDAYTKTDTIALNSAIDLYIKSKQSVLSPSTLNGYLSIKKNYFADIGSTQLYKLTNDQIQLWISKLSIDHSPKTVRNIYMLLTSAISMFRPDFRPKITLPQKRKPELYVPTDGDIKILLNHIKGTELEIAVLLAAFGPMRRGEICALTSDDICENTVSVNKSMVLSSDGTWAVKTPKTYSSYREIVFPDFVIGRIKDIDGRIVKATPNQISSRFRRAVKFSHLTHFRFHDLRHYSASILHALGIPDQYIMQRGGWASDSILKTVYRGTMDDQTQKFNKIAFQHFQNMQHEMQHDTKKVP